MSKNAKELPKNHPMFQKKSHIVRKMAKSMGIPCIELKLSSLPPINDILGTPSVKE